MSEHAPELLQGALWVIWVLGSLIIALFGAGLAVIKWAITRYEANQQASMKQINSRLDNQDTSLEEIKEFMSAELRELREWFHRLDKEVLLIKNRFYNSGNHNHNHDDGQP